MYNVGDHVVYERFAQPGDPNFIRIATEQYNGSEGVVTRLIPITAGRLMDLEVTWTSGKLQHFYHHDFNNVIPVQSKNVRPLWTEIPYDPTQEPDEEDDI